MPDSPTKWRRIFQDDDIAIIIPDGEPEPPDDDEGPEIEPPGAPETVIPILPALRNRIATWWPLSPVRSGDRGVIHSQKQIELGRLVAILFLRPFVTMSLMLTPFDGPVAQNGEVV